MKQARSLQFCRLPLACWLVALLVLSSASAVNAERDGVGSHDATGATGDAGTPQGLSDDNPGAGAFHNLTQGKIQEATDHYIQHLKQHPEDAFARYNFAVALGNSGRVAEAIAHLEMIWQGKPRDALSLALKDQVNLALSRLHLRQGDAEAEIQALKRIRLEGAFAAQRLTQLGTAYARSRRVEEAINAWEQLTGYYPAEAGVSWLWYGDMLAKQGNTSKAVDVYRNALALFGQQRSAIANVATISQGQDLLSAVRGLPLVLEELFSDSAFINTWREFSNRKIQQQIGSQSGPGENRWTDQPLQREELRRIFNDKLKLHDDKLKVYMDQARFQLARIMDEAMGQ